jgi:MOSC domain-containing protein YiiM
MFEGRLEGIYIGERKGEELHKVEAVEAVAGSGLTGDRYAYQQGTFSKPGSPDREVTLIESEALDALAQECEIVLRPGQTRRNLLTRGVPLNHLVQKEFTVGDVVLRGIRLCEPCDHLEKLTIKGVKTGLCHRGGLRAQIIRGGVIRTGDSIRGRETAFSSASPQRSPAQ